MRRRAVCAVTALIMFSPMSPHGPPGKPSTLRFLHTDSTKHRLTVSKKDGPTYLSAPQWLPTANPNQRRYLVCVRRLESHDHYVWGWNPFGTGDGGGAYQMEPGTLRTAAALVGVPVTNHSRQIQDEEALALVRKFGAGPWYEDACTLIP